MPQGKDILAADLDIFGGGGNDGEVNNEVGDEFDIFWGLADFTDQDDKDSDKDVENDTQSSTWDDDMQVDNSGNDDTPTGDSTEPIVTENTEDKNEGGEELDIDIENLFADIENESKGDPEMESLVDSLRGEVSRLSTEKSMLEKENNTLNEKLMSRVWDDANLGIYKWVISNLESNPKLMMLVKHIWNQDSDAMKSKLVNIVTDLLHDLTGEDVSDLINRDQSSKILAVAGKWASSSVPDMAWKPDTEMDYDESINALF